MPGANRPILTTVFPNTWSKFFFEMKWVYIYLSGVSHCWLWWQLRRNLTDKPVQCMFCVTAVVCKWKSIHEKVLVLPVQLMDHWGFSVAPHHHLLLLQLFCHLDECKQQSFKTRTVSDEPINPSNQQGYRLTSFAEEPETSIQVLEKKAHDPSMKTM